MAAALVIVCLLSSGGALAQESPTPSDFASLSPSPSASVSVPFKFTNYTNVTINPGGDAVPVTTCASSAYLASVNAYVAQSIVTNGAACRVNIAQLALQQFSPPTAYDMMTAVCKGSCRSYTETLALAQSAATATGCSLAEVFNGSYFPVPQPTVELLCASVNASFINANFTVNGVRVCPAPPAPLSEALWQQTVCSASACGRSSTNEVDFRTARSTCGFTDGAAAAALGNAALALAVLASAVLHNR